MSWELLELPSAAVGSSFSGGAVASYASVSEAEEKLQLMRRTVNPSTDLPIKSATSRADVKYIAAALCVQRSLFPKQNGEPNYAAAAKHYVPVPNSCKR